MYLSPVLPKGAETLGGSKVYLNTPKPNSKEPYKEIITKNDTCRFLRVQVLKGS